MQLDHFIFPYIITIESSLLEWYTIILLFMGLIAIFRRKITKRKLESHILHYLYENGFECKKEEGELYFIRRSLKYYIEIISLENRYIIYFSLLIEDEEYMNQFNMWDKLLLGHHINTTYQLIKVRNYNDSYYIDTYLDIETINTFEKNFLNIMSEFDRIRDDIAVKKEEIIKMHQNERKRIGF